MENLYRLQYHSQPIIFVKSVLPSPRDGRKRLIEEKGKKKTKKTGCLHQPSTVIKTVWWKWYFLLLD